MTNQPITRDYKFSDATLKQNADDLIDSVTRDIVDFTHRGVADTSVIEGLRRSFDAYSGDSYYRGIVSIKTQERDALVEGVTRAIVTIKIMAINKWRNKSDARYTIFDFDELAGITPRDLVALAKNVITVGAAQLTELANQGLTQAMLDNLAAKRGQLDGKIDEKRKAVKTRDLATQSRIIAGNALYAEIVKLTNIGKDLYQYDNEAKYNNYLIYNTRNTKAPKPQPTPPAGTATVKGMVTAQADNDPLEGAIVQNKTTANTVTTYANGSFTDISAIQGDNLYTVTATGFKSKTVVKNVTIGQLNELLIRLERLPDEP